MNRGINFSVPVALHVSKIVILFLSCLIPDNGPRVGSIFQKRPVSSQLKILSNWYSLRIFCKSLLICGSCSRGALCASPCLEYSRIEYLCLKLVNQPEEPLKSWLFNNSANFIPFCLIIESVIVKLHPRAFSI